MKMPSELPAWFTAIIYRLRQSWMTISADDISQLELSRDLREFFENILSIVKSDVGTLPRSDLVDQIIRLGANEIEEKITAIEVVIGRKQRKISTQYVTNQFNFYGKNKSEGEKSTPKVTTRSPTVTALCKAFSSQSIEECQSLLTDFNRANINGLDDATDDTALICAVRSAITLKDIPQAINKTRLLLAHQASVNGVNGYGSTALHFAAKLNLKDICVLLVENDASLVIMNKGGDTPIQSALANGHIELAKYLFDQLGTNRLKFLHLINPENENSILHCAAKVDASDFLQYIISRCLPILEGRNKLGQTPLLCAVYHQSFNSMGILIGIGASAMAEVTEFVDNKYWASNLDVRHNPYFMGATTLHLANHKLLEYLLQQPKFPDINDANNSHRCSPLHSAIIAKDLQKVLLLHKHSADILQKNEEGHTSFHLAAISLSEVIGYYLICECPMLLLAQDKYGMTALHWAILKGFRTFTALTLYLAKFYEVENKLAQIKVSAEKVVVMGDAYRIKGSSYLDLFTLPVAQTVSKSKDMSPLLKEGESLAEQYRTRLLDFTSPSETMGIVNK